MKRFIFTVLAIILCIEVNPIAIPVVCAADRIAVYRLKISEGDTLRYDITIEAPIGRTTWFKDQISTPYIVSKGVQDTEKKSGWFFGTKQIVKGEQVVFDQAKSGLEVSITPAEQSRVGRLLAELDISLTSIEWQKINGGTFGVIEQPTKHIKNFGQQTLLAPGESTNGADAYSNDGDQPDGIAYQLTLKKIYFKP